MWARNPLPPKSRLYISPGHQLLLHPNDEHQMDTATGSALREDQERKARKPGSHLVRINRDIRHPAAAAVLRVQYNKDH